MNDQKTNDAEGQSSLNDGLERDTMRNLLKLFLEIDDVETEQIWFLPRKYHSTFNVQTMNEAISLGYVKFTPLPKGSTGWNGYMITPSGRMFLRRNA